MLGCAQSPKTILMDPFTALFSSTVSIIWVYTLVIVIAIFVGYHWYTLNHIAERTVDVEDYDRSDWLGIIRNSREPVALRQKLIYALAYAPDATRSELEYLAFYLPNESGFPREILEHKHTIRAITFAEKQLKLSEASQG